MEYLTGKIHIKNNQGNLETFYQDISSITNQYYPLLDKNNIISRLGTIYSDSEYPGKVKVITSLDAANNYDIKLKSLFSYLHFDENEMCYIVDTSYTSGITGLPFTQYSFSESTTKIKVDWGDGNVSEITKSNVISNPSVLCHTYATPGKYYISITSDDWDEVYIATDTRYVAPTNIQANDNMMYFKNTLFMVLSTIKGSGVVDSIGTTYDDSYDYLFSDCKHLTDVNSETFLNIDITSLRHTFDGCVSLIAIPNNILDMFWVKSFDYCFANCSSINIQGEKYISIYTDDTPTLKSFEGMFKNCTSIETLPIFYSYNSTNGSSIYDDNYSEYIDNIKVDYCFEGCTSITYIPSNIFTDINISSLKGVFKGCSSISNVPAGLFDNLTVTDYSECFKNCTKLKTVAKFLFYKSSATNFTSCFEGCTALKNMKLYFDMDNAITCDNFVTYNQNNQIYVCVNNNSAKQGSFQNIVNSTGILLNTNCTDLYSFEYTLRAWRDWDNNIGDYANTASYVFGCPFIIDYKSNKQCDLFIDLGNNTYRSVNNKIYESGTEPDIFDINWYGKYYNNRVICTDPNLCVSYDGELLSIPLDENDINEMEENGNNKAITIKIISDSFENSYLGKITGFLSYSDVENLINFYINVLSIDTPFPATNGMINYKVISNNVIGEIEKLTVCDFSQMFRYHVESDTPIVNICQNLFINYPNATNFTSCFESCSSLKTLPENLFRYNTAAINFSNCFYRCESLENISQDLFKYNTAATDFSNCFYQCTSLASIPAGLFNNCTDATNFSYCFYGCTSLTSIPAGLFDNCTDATNFSMCFYGCTSLASIPAGLFDDCINVTNFSGCFADCSSLTSIPSGLFDNNINVSQFGRNQQTNWWTDSGCFEGCSSLTTIPQDLFKYNTVVTDFSGCFANCSSLSSIPADLFKYNTVVINFASCFYYCSSLASIPTGLFDSCISATNFSQCFCYCSSLASIPAGLFDNCTDVINFAGCFSNCSNLTTIPTGLFDNNTLVTTFEDCFFYCTSLTTLPTDLFKYNTAVITFFECFRGCSSLTTIPSDLFRYNTEVTTFNYCFAYCSALTTIGDYAFANKNVLTAFSNTFSNCNNIETIGNYAFANCNKVTSFGSMFSGKSNLVSVGNNVFENCTSATTFANCFQNCSLLTTIGNNIFKNCTAATNFNNCFRYCTALTSIPSGIFENCTAVTTTQYCFAYCSSLTTIPVDLFRYSTAITDFQYCFQNCTSLTTIPTDLFRYNTLVTTFYTCFEYCSSLTSIPQDLFRYNTAVTNFGYCFHGCSSLITIPKKLFKYNTVVTSFVYCFNSTPIKDFKIIIGSSVVSNFNSFVNQIESNRIICAPYNSTTYTTINATSGYYYTVYDAEENCGEYFEYLINTQATTPGAKLGAIPVIATSNDYPITVDWGDSNSNTLYLNDFTLAGYIHEYASAGDYNITIYSEEPEYINMVSVSGDTNATTEPIRIFRDTYLGNQMPI